VMNDAVKIIIEICSRATNLRMFTSRHYESMDSHVLRSGMLTEGKSSCPSVSLRGKVKSFSAGIKIDLITHLLKED
jgi:hypothetical protein